MLLDLDSEMRALQSHEIRTHKDALAHFTVRYSSFTTPNYPLDAPLPAFALAEHGFHFDSYTRAIKCVTCDYTNTDLFDDLLLSVLNKHLRASPQCEQARRSLSLILSESSVAAEPPLETKLGGVAIGSSAPTKRPAASNPRSSIAAVAAAAINKQFATEEARIKSFDNEKLIIGIAKLAANGLYRVPKQDLLLLSASKDKAVAKKPFSSGGGSMNKSQHMSKLSLLRGDQMKANDQEEGDEEMSNVLGEVTQTSQIEAIAKSLPTLYHVRCAYCPYECLLFKTSLLNTLYKSPFDEHREKHGSRCPIFALNSDLAGSKSTSSGVDLHRDLAFNIAKEKNIPQPDLTWLQTLYEFESPHHHQSTPNQMRRTSSMRNLGSNLQSLNESSTTGNKHPMLAKNLLSHSDDGQDVELREMPKIIDKLYEIYNQASRPMRPMTTSASSGAALCNPLVYVPGSVGGKNAIKSMTTSDFSQLQTVLNKSDNVLSRKAHHPDYAQYQARLDSFKEWPASMSQQPSDLAKAGFYYFGIKDMVKCFFCNGGLKNWDHNDDPFQDHVRWFPTCQYIRQLMGHEYIETVREKFKNMESGFNDENLGDRPSDRGNSGGGGGDRLNASTSSLQSTTTNRPSGSTSSSFSWSSSSSSHHQQSPPPQPQQQHQQRSVSPRTLNSRMDSYMVRRILDHSLISRESIRNAYEMQLSSPPSTSVDQHSSRHPTASLYNDDFHSPIEMALASYSIDRNKRFKAESFEHLSDFVIFNLSPKVTVSAIVGFVYVKYGLYPMSVRILREHGQNENRCFVLVSLQPKDRRHLNDIIKDLNKTSNELESLKTKMPIVVARTVWSEIEERAKSLLDKPIVKPLASTPSIEQQPPVTPTRSLSLESSSAKTNDEAMDVTPSSSVSKEDEPAKKMTMSGDDSSTPVDDALQLKEENERLKNERLCVVCLGREKNVLFLPCAHLTACLECSLSLQNCPMCRSKIQATVRTFT